MSTQEQLHIPTEEAVAMEFIDQVLTHMHDIRGLTPFDLQVHADVGGYKPTGEDIVVVESFNARLAHLDDRIATFTRSISYKDYNDRARLFIDDPEAYRLAQIDNLRR